MAMSRIVLVFIVFASLLAGSCVAGREHDKQLFTSAHRIMVGMPSSQVVKFLGSPTWRDRCGARFPYGWSQRCAIEYGYRSAFAPIIPLYLVVQLDVHGQVISADTIQSP